MYHVKKDHSDYLANFGDSSMNLKELHRPQGRKKNEIDKSEKQISFKIFKTIQDLIKGKSET